MEYVIALLGSLIAVALLVVIVPYLGGGEVESRRGLPRAEKDQMDSPQEEFVEDAEPPSIFHRQHPG